ncbi:MAG: hypothetical protein Q9182_002218 [Xanthomendoza sp. 2 TL-2023]
MPNGNSPYLDVTNAGIPINFQAIAFRRPPPVPGKPRARVLKPKPSDESDPASSFSSHRGTTEPPMSFYEAQSWQLPMRQASWDQPPPPPSRTGTNSAIPNDEIPAFDMQIEGSNLSGMSQHRHSIGDYDQMRPPSGTNLQSFYANQRHQSRPNEAEQMMQAKRRMAAQRERELRNYHQEQQYNRSRSN